MSTRTKNESVSFLLIGDSGLAYIAEQGYGFLRI